MLMASWRRRHKTLAFGDRSNSLCVWLERKVEGKSEHVEGREVCSRPWAEPLLVSTRGAGALINIILGECSECLSHLRSPGSAQFRASALPLLLRF